MAALWIRPIKCFQFLICDIYFRLDFRRLPGPVFDPPRRETAGRVTRWPCLWRKWQIDNLGVSDITGSETGLQFSYLFGSKLHQAFPYGPKRLSKYFFRYISLHFEKDSSVHFCTPRHAVNFLWSSNICCVLGGSELTDCWKRNKLNEKVYDLPDRISSVLNVPLSNINVDGYICNERSYRDLKRLEKILEDAKSLQPQSFTTNNRTKRCFPSDSRISPSVSAPSKLSNNWSTNTSNNWSTNMKIRNVETVTDTRFSLKP